VTPGTGGTVAPGTGGSTPGDTAKDTSPGSGGASGTGGAPPAAGDLNYLERNGDIAKSGWSIRPMMTKTKAATIALDTTFAANFQGAVWSSPLYVEKGPMGKGTFYVATASNTVYALDETTGAVVWMKNLGTPATGAACGCCNYGIPQGIYGTPVIDLASRTLFAVAATGGGGGITGFQTFGLNIDDGSTRPGWPVAAPFGAGKHNQRTALSLVRGILYVAYGGHQGDCGPYNGRVMAINIATPQMTGLWTTAGSQSGIWGAGGMASDGDGIFTLTGNGSGAGGGHGDSEELIRLTGLSVANKTNATHFYPRRWQAMDGADLDFSCNAPAVFDIPGATPMKHVVAPAKDGHLYFLDAANLGGMGGEKFDLQVAAEGMSTRTSPTAYSTTKGKFVAISTNGGRCPMATGGGSVIMGIQVSVTAGAIRPTVAWCAARGGDMVAPISTTTDAAGTDSIVWWVGTGGGLNGVDGETGAKVATVNGGCSIRRWGAPIVGGANRIVAAADGKLCAWSVK
jgi:hypothetical protein